MELSGIQVTTFLGPNNLRNIEAFKQIFILKMSKFYVDSKNEMNISVNVFGLW